LAESGKNPINPTKKKTKKIQRIQKIRKKKLITNPYPVKQKKYNFFLEIVLKL